MFLHKGRIAAFLVYLQAGASVSHETTFLFYFALVPACNQYVCDLSIDYRVKCINYLPLKDTENQIATTKNTKIHLLSITTKIIR